LQQSNKKIKGKIRKAQIEQFDSKHNSHFYRDVSSCVVERQQRRHGASLCIENNCGWIGNFIDQVGASGERRRNKTRSVERITFFFFSVGLNPFFSAVASITGTPFEQLKRVAHIARPARHAMQSGSNAG
jgi:hypothetical protein